MVRCTSIHVDECIFFTCQMYGECFIYLSDDELRDLGFSDDDIKRCR